VAGLAGGIDRVGSRDNVEYEGDAVSDRVELNVLSTQWQLAICQLTRTLNTPLVAPP